MASPSETTCTCEVHDDTPWVVILPVDVSDEYGVEEYHTVVGPFDTWEQASDYGYTHSYSIVSPMVPEEDCCG